MPITLSADQFTQMAVTSIKSIPPPIWLIFNSTFITESKKTVEDVANWVAKDIGATIEIHKKALRRIILAILLYETKCLIPMTTTSKQPKPKLSTSQLK